LKRKAFEFKICRSKRDNISLLIAVTEEKILGYKLFSGSVKESDYWIFISQLLKHNDLLNIKYVLIHDNGKCHKTAKISDEIAKHLNFMYLPSYSPYLNIAENVFGEIKREVRRYVYASVDQLIEMIVKSISGFDPTKLIKFYSHSLIFYRTSLEMKNINI
jgi:transposase